MSKLIVYNICCVILVFMIVHIKNSECSKEVRCGIVKDIKETKDSKGNTHYTMYIDYPYYGIQEKSILAETYYKYKRGETACFYYTKPEAEKRIKWCLVGFFIFLVMCIIGIVKSVDE